MTYSKSDIESLFPRIKRGRLQEWVREGYITPYQAATQGQTALFDRTNIYQIVLFDALLKAGALRPDAAQMISYIKTYKYFIKTEKPVKPPLRGSGGWQSTNKIPPFEPGTYKTFTIIDIPAIKKDVDLTLG
jgi:hypothetical protein